MHLREQLSQGVRLINEFGPDSKEVTDYIGSATPEAKTLIELSRSLKRRLNADDPKGWRPALTSDICFMTELLFYNARAKVCECDTPCSCLEFHDIIMTVDDIYIQTRDKVFKLKVSVEEVVECLK